MWRIPFTSLDGHSNHAQFYNDIISNTEREQEVRLSSRVLQWGVASGLVVSDANGVGVTGVDVTKGWAYTAQGWRTLVSADTFVALDSSDAGKYLVATRSWVSGGIEAHPVNGVTGYTQIIDTTTLSAVASPNSASGHVRLCLIESVSKFPGTSDVRQIETADRDVLRATARFPYITIGPTGDGDADYTGNNHQPFVDAIDALTVTSGGVIYIKHGHYDLSSGGGGKGLAVSGFGTVRFIGEGKGTTWEGSGGYIFRFLNNSEISIEGISMYANGATHGMLRITDVDTVRFHNNYCTGHVNRTHMMEPVSGISNLYINDNTFAHMDIMPFKCNALAPAGSIGNVYFESNYCSAAMVPYHEQIENFVLRNNFFDDCGIRIIHNNYAYYGPLGAVTSTMPPKRFIFENNFLDCGINATLNWNVTGAIIASNSIIDRSTFPVQISDHYNSTTSSGDFGNFSQICNNFIRIFNSNRYNIYFYCPTAGARVSGTVIDGNILMGNDSAGQVGVYISTDGDHTIINSNIYIQLATDVTDSGTGNWYQTTDNTSNIAS